MARGFRLSSGITKLLVPVAVVGAVGFLAWYLAINPTTRIIDLFGFLSPPPQVQAQNPALDPRMQQGIPVDNQMTNVRTTGEFGEGYQPFAGSAEEDVGAYGDDNYEKVSLSS